MILSHLFVLIHLFQNYFKGDFALESQTQVRVNKINQKQVSDQLLSNVEVELQRGKIAGNTRNGNTVENLQESMDNDLESHKLSHGLKTRLHRAGDEAQEDVEDVGDEDIMDDVLEEE